MLDFDEICGRLMAGIFFNMILDATPTLSLEQARAVQWPFKELKGQLIGSLYDSGAISLKDLGFAAERAYNPRVRAAARTLLLNRLLVSDDPTQLPAGAVNVVRSEMRSFAERRQLEMMLSTGVIIGIMLGASLFYLLQQLFDGQSLQTTVDNLNRVTFVEFTLILTFILIVVSILTAPMFFWSRWFANRLERQLKLHRQGQLAEERVLNALYHHLDTQWWVFRNLEMPGQKAGDVDFVVVGPSGVWALEVKALSGEYRNVGDRWEKCWRGRWLSAYVNPTKQAKRNATAIHHVLQTHTIKQWVAPIIVWANEDAPIAVENPAVPVWRLGDLGDNLEQVISCHSLAEAQREKVITALKSLYNKPFAADDEA